MRILRSLAMAFLMYSRVPMPQVEWKEENMAYAMGFFPIVGLLEGLVLMLWYLLCSALNIGAVLFAAGAVLLPVAINGGIHLDGFCDCCDALASHQSRERKLEIMKDSAAGAFAVICCCAYLLLYTAVWTEVERTSCPATSRKYSAMVRPVRPTRILAPGGSFICPYTRAVLSITPDSFISFQRSLPSRVRSPTPANTE